MPIPDPVKNALEGAGISAEALDRIRLARGFVGKASYVAGVALIVVGGIALRAAESSVLIFGIFALAIFAIYFGGTLWFAHRHPGEALLEGAELIKWRQMEMAAKNLLPPPSQPPKEIGSSREPE
jgi:hypothetical protein